MQRRMFPSSSWGLRGATTGAWVDGPRLTESHQGPQGGPANAQPANKTEANEGATVCNTVAPPLGTPSPVLLTLQDVAERFQGVASHHWSYSSTLASSERC